MNIMSNYTILIMTNDKIEKLFYALRLMERIGMTLSICPASRRSQKAMKDLSRTSEFHM